MLLTAASLGLRTISMVFQVYLSNLVGAAGIGLLQLTMSVGMLAGTVGTAGVRVAAMYLCAEEHGHRRPAGIRLAMRYCFFYALLLSVAAGLALIHFSTPLAENWIQDSRAAAGLRVFGAFLPISVLWAVLDGYFTATGRIGRLVAVESGERIVSMVLTVSLLRFWAGDDIERACCAMIFGSGAASAIGLLFILQLYWREQRAIYTGREVRRSMLGRLLRLAIPVGFNDILRGGLSTLEHLLIPRGLARSGSSSENAMAAYGTIHGMVFPILMFPAAVLFALSDLLVPELASCCARHSKRRILHMTDKCLRMGLLFAAAVSGAIYCMAGPLGWSLYHSADTGYYLRVFAPLIFILYMDTIVDGMHKGLGQQIHCVRYNTFTSLLDVVLLFFLLPRFGIAGYFFSFTATHAVNFYLSIARLVKFTGYAPPLGYVLKILLSALFSIFLTNQLVTGWTALPGWLFCLLAAGVYLAVLTLLVALSRACSAEDWRWLWNTIRGKSTAMVED